MDVQNKARFVQGSLADEIHLIEVMHLDDVVAIDVGYAGPTKFSFVNSSSGLNTSLSVEVGKLSSKARWIVSYCI